MNPFAQFPGLLLTLAATGTAAAAVAYFLNRMLRGKAAALRHFVWLLALCAPLLASPLGWMHARIAIPILSRPADQGLAGDTAPESEPPPARPFFSGPGAASLAPLPPRIPAPRTGFLMACNLWGALWLSGAAFILVRILLSQLRVRSLIRMSGSPTPEPLVHCFNKWKLHFHLARPVGLIVSRLTEIPFCTGVFRPTVIFPESWTQWEAERVEVCLTHELAHVVRRDLLAMLAGQLSCTLCWFNPFVWIAAARLRDEAENAADDLVLAGNFRPETYAASLVAITESFRASALTPTIALSMGRPNRLRARVEAILDPGLRRNAPGPATLLLVTILAAGALTAAMVVRLTAAPAATGDYQKPDLGAIDLKTIDPQQEFGIWEMVQNAIKAGDAETVKAMLDRGLNVNMAETEDCSLLWEAVDADQLGIVNLLIARGANLNQKTDWGDIPVGRACWRGYKDIADALVKAGAQREDLLYYTGMGDAPALAALDKKQPVTPAQARRAITFAVASGHTGTFDWLWGKLGPMNPGQRKDLLERFYASAAKWGQLAMLQHLEKIGGPSVKPGAEALQYAIAYHFPAIAKYLLDEGVSPNVSQPNRPSMLRDAAGEGDIEIVKLLLEHGADTSARDTQGFTPLAWAAENGHDDVCLLLLQHGADPKIKDEWGENATWWAAGGPHCPAALEAMIKQGVPVTGVNNQGQTIFGHMVFTVAPEPGKVAFPGKIYSAPEIQAYNARERRVVDLLAAAGADINGRPGSETPLMTAISLGHYAAAGALIADGADLKVKDQQGDDALSYVFQWVSEYPGDFDLVEPMLRLGCDPNEVLPVPGVTPPAMASVLEEAISALRSNDPAQIRSLRRAVQLLLDAGGVFPGVINPHDQALLLAAMQAAVAQGASVNARDASGLTAITISTSLGYSDETRWLLDQKAEPNVIHGLNVSPLQAAVMQDNAGLVDLLLARGAKPTRGQSGLDWAVRYGDQRIFDALLKAGADPNDSRIFSCIQHGRVNMARTLLDRGVDPQPRDNSENRGNVYWAVSYNQPEILKMLLDHGADPSWKDVYGATPLAIAKRGGGGRQEMVAMLEAALQRAPGAKLRILN